MSILLISGTNTLPLHGKGTLHGWLRLWHLIGNLVNYPSRLNLTMEDFKGRALNSGYMIKRTQTKCLRDLKHYGWAYGCLLVIIEVLHGKEWKQLLLGCWQGITDSRAILKKGILTMSSVTVGLDFHPKTPQNPRRSPDRRPLWFCL